MTVWHQLALAALFGLCMFAQDTLGGIYVVVMDRGRGFLAGVFDGLSDVFMLYSIGGGGSETIRHPWSVLGFGTPATVLVGSVLGAGLGEHISHHFTGKAVGEHRAAGVARHLWARRLWAWLHGHLHPSAQVTPP